MSRLLKITTLALVLFSFAACSDDTTGPGFAGPDLSGTWTGEWRDADVVMSLQQSGAKVSGTLTIGLHEYDIDGTVSSDGVFDWGGPATNLPNCVGIGSVRENFQVMAQGSKMEGVASRGERVRDTDGNCGSRALVQQGTMTLERAI